jgi:glycerate-2-kinase
VGALALGKAGAAMAAACEAALGDAITFGLVVTKDGHGLPLRRFALREAGHPLPDLRSRAAGQAVAACAGRPADVLLVLLSGGASALCTCPLPGLELDAVVASTRALLEGGASIEQLNTVRKHLLELSGGRLARAVAAPRVQGLVLSDVPGDRLDVIASGPLTPDPTTYTDALDAAAESCGLDALAPAVRAHLEAGARGERPESPKPGEACFARVQQRVLAGNRTALAAAARAAAAEGLAVEVLDDPLEGEARDAGERLARRALEARGAKPRLWLAGGETTVRVAGDGKGGRCQELALAAARVLEGHAGVSLLAAGSDGTDGPTDAAGAFADGGTVARGRASGVEADEALRRNDSYGFFAAEGGLLRTGPTRTNVMDVVAIALDPVGA